MAFWDSASTRTSGKPGRVGGEQVDLDAVRDGRETSDIGSCKVVDVGVACSEPVWGVSFNQSSLSICLSAKVISSGDTCGGA